MSSTPEFGEEAYASWAKDKIVIPGICMAAGQEGVSSKAERRTR
jgi:hypothetical protein